MDGGHLRLRDVPRVDPAQALALGVHQHHDPERLGRALVEDALEHLHDELHGRVVVVEQDDLEQVGLPLLGAGLLGDAALGLGSVASHDGYACSIPFGGAGAGFGYNAAAAGARRT